MKAKDYPFKSVRISCYKCGRRGRYTRAAFGELVGAKTELPDALARISADCAKRQTTLAYDQCMALYPDLVRSDAN
jgi:hypothetical protein